MFLPRVGGERRAGTADLPPAPLGATLFVAGRLDATFFSPARLDATLRCAWARHFWRQGASTRHFSRPPLGRDTFRGRSSHIPPLIHAQPTGASNITHVHTISPSHPFIKPIPPPHTKVLQIFESWAHHFTHIRTILPPPPPFSPHTPPQVLQIFESWAHQLSEEQWVTFAKPYADEVRRVARIDKKWVSSGVV